MTSLPYFFISLKMNFLESCFLEMLGKKIFIQKTIKNFHILVFYKCCNKIGPKNLVQIGKLMENRNFKPRCLRTTKCMRDQNKT